MEDTMLRSFANLEDVFTYADIDNVEQTKLDTIRVAATIRKTGEQVFIEDDTLSAATERLFDIIERKRWMLDDILEEYDLSVDELRALLDGPEAYSFSDAYDEGYDNGWADAEKYKEPSSDLFEQMLIDAETAGYDDGYMDGFHDRYQVSRSIEGLESYPDERVQEDEDYQFVAAEDWDMERNPGIALNPTIVLAGQPLILRNDKTDETYIAYRVGE